jgi:thiamine-monophosphate kinase
MQIEDLGEFPLIEQLLAQIGRSGPGVAVGAGDDAAALIPTPGMLLLATCDSQTEGRHFRRDHISPEQLGRRLAAVNLSDIAAMGGQPRWALVSLHLPPATEASYIEAVYRGLMRELEPFSARIVGGNMAAGDQLVLDLTLLGEIAPAELLGRTGAHADDLVLVSGSLGASAAGRAALAEGLSSPEAQATIEAHLTPRARVALGRAIAKTGLATAMIDVSDGFAQDLGHICDASRVGVRINAADLPLAAETHAVAHTVGADPLQWALTGGEDYELILTAPREAAGDLARIAERELGLALTPVGTILESKAERWLEDANAERTPLGTGGWSHFGSISPLT